MEESGWDVRWGLGWRLTGGQLDGGDDGDGKLRSAPKVSHGEIIPAKTDETVNSAQRWSGVSLTHVKTSPSSFCSFDELLRAGDLNIVSRVWDRGSHTSWLSDNRVHLHLSTLHSKGKERRPKI